MRSSFVEVRQDDNPILLNVTTIRQVLPFNYKSSEHPRAVIYLFGSGRSITTDETYDTVLALIRKAGGNKLTVRASDLNPEGTGNAR